MSRLKKKHAKDQKQLYTQYYNDIYTLQEQLNQYASAAEHYKSLASQIQESAELDAMQRDYDEFKQPDLDGDDRISRAEFNMYVKNYLSNYPGLTEADYPRFADFDHDMDGSISFQEYTAQMALMVQQADMEARRGGGSGEKARAMGDLLGDGMKKGQFDRGGIYGDYR